ncbi:hypothetical protein [Mycolicibacterium sp.]|nr:hypothetical protein [Mycolicibacterium sp.]
MLTSASVAVGGRMAMTAERQDASSGGSPPATVLIAGEWGV